MCGRIACTLRKEDIQRAVQRYSPENELPKWIEKYPWQCYSSNFNLSPCQISPVLIMKDHELKEENIALCPMRWGLIPYWYSGALKDYNVKTNNCRLESILEKPTYKHSLINGRRCVILSDGFYEWKISSNGKTQPYFIHFPNENGLKMSHRTWENESFISETNDWEGPRLLTMAGIFDIWKAPEFGKLYSYSIITMNSSNSMSSIHHRMPAILDGDDEVRMWLDSKSVTYKDAVANLKAVENLEFYAVASEVNNSRNNNVNCVKPMISKGLTRVDKTSRNPNTLLSWLKRKPQPIEDCDHQHKQVKFNN